MSLLLFRLVGGRRGKLKKEKIFIVPNVYSDSGISGWGFNGLIPGNDSNYRFKNKEFSKLLKNVFSYKT